MTLLEVDAIRAGYGRINVLSGLSFALAPGEFLGVLGHNGMGKTTLLNAIIGLLPLTAGDIRLNGASIRSLPAHARARLGLGYVPQGRQIFPQLTVRENLAIAAVANRHSAGAAVERVLAEFPLLRPLADRTGGSLSGGEQQILALGRALCGDPQLILLDEPTEGVQPSIVDQIADVLAQLHSTRKLSIILVEQNLDFIRSLANRIVVLEKGRIVYSTNEQSGDNVAELVAAAGFGPPPGRTHPHGPTPQPRAQEENHA